MRSRFLDELPTELTDQAARISRGFPAPGRIASWAGAAAASAEASGGGDASVFRVGEDVVHAKLGDGVVTGIEPGGIVVVRFADDGSERKLMADFAPIKKR
jgi:DNA helicase-2/ATP-dependent DNA helicase PcrA